MSAFLFSYIACTFGVKLPFCFILSLTCRLMIFSSKLSQSILSSDIGSWMAERSASSVTFFSRRPAWWFRRSISICSWYASPLNSWQPSTCSGTPNQSTERRTHRQYQLCVFRTRFVLLYIKVNPATLWSHFLSAFELTQSRPWIENSA